MEELRDLIIKLVKERTGKTLNGVYYHGESDQKKTNDLYNVNNTWNGLNFVICNTKITVGVSYEGISNFDKVYIAIAGFNEPRDIIQVSYRARTLNHNLIKMCIIDRFNPNVDYKNDENYFKPLNNIDVACPIYREVVKNILIERWCPLQQKLLLFIKKAGYTIINGDCILDEIF